MSAFALRLFLRRLTNHLRIITLALASAASQILSPAIGLSQQQPKVPHASKTSSGTLALLDEAKKLVRDGDPQGALAVLRQADLQGSTASDVHAMKGICFALLAKPIESAAEFDQAINLRPNYAPVPFLSRLGLCGFQQFRSGSRTAFPCAKA